MKINFKKNEQIILELGRTDVWAYLVKEGKLVQLERPSASTQAEILGAVLSNCFAIRKKAELILLSSDCFYQEVGLSAAQQQGLTKNELSSVLAYEVEPFSGISPQSCVLGFAPKGAGFAVIELAEAELGELLRVGRANSVELKVIMQAAIAFESAEEIESRLKAIATASLTDLAKSQPVIITKDVASKGFAAGIAELSPDAFKSLMVRIAAAVILLCGLHYFVFSEVILKGKQEELAKLEAPVAKLNQTRNAIAKIKHELKTLQEKDAGASGACTMLGARHMAWNSFFSIVAESCGDFVFVKGIDCAPDCVSLKLFSVHKDAELRFYEALSKNGIAKMGWIVDTQSRGRKSANEFCVLLHYNEQNAVKAFVEKQALAASNSSGEEK